MPFCPKCRDEFQDWAKTCPDCRVALVAELPPEPEPTPKPGHAWTQTRSTKAKDELVILASASSDPEAKMWAGILEENGIQCMVKPYAPGGYNSASHTPFRTIWSTMVSFDVYVMESDVERAREILANTPQADSGTDRSQRVAAASPGGHERLVPVATPSNAAEAAMLAEALEENGIHCVDKGIPRHPRRATRPSYELCVPESDAGRAKEILAKIADSAARAEPIDGQPAKKRRLITSAVGIIDIVSGIISLSLGVGFWATGALSDADSLLQPYARVGPIALVVIGILAIPGGVCTLQRRNWWMAVAGNVALALSIFPLGLLFLGPIVIYRDEFE
jgi:hypothetical protein